LGSAIQFGPIYRYSSVLDHILTGLLPEYAFVIENHSISATGVNQWVLCGISPTDIVISEFRINEGNIELLEKWYDIIYHSSRHFIVLDLWLILSPPQVQVSPTIAAIPKTLRHEENYSYSILPFDKMYLHKWKKYISIYFNCNELIDPSFKECLFSFDTNNNKQNCTKTWGHYLQHGNNNFHFDVALELAFHIRTNVLSKLFLIQDNNQFNDTARSRQKNHLLSSAHHSICFSEYHTINGSKIGIFQNKVVYLESNIPNHLEILEKKAYYYNNDDEQQYIDIVIIKNQVVNKFNFLAY
jgi:hypothetical protein